MDFLSSMFDPKNFAGITGLLDRLGPGASLPVPQQPAAFGLAGPAAPAMLPQPADQPSPLDSAQWPYGPTGAPSDANARLPANAAPTSGIAPMGLAPPSMDGPMNFLGGVRDKINDNSNMLLGLAAGIAGGRNWGDGISKGMSLAMQGGQLDARQGNSNRTQQFLLSKGMDPETARTVASNPTLLRSVLPQLMGTKDKTNDVKNFEYAAEHPEFAKFLAAGKNGGSEIFGTPIYGRDPESGKTVLGAIGKDSRFHKLDTGGVEVSPGVTWKDFGTYQQAFDRSGNPVGPQVPKDVAGAEAAKVEGKARGEARATLPSDLQAGEAALKEVDDLVKSEGFNEIFGPLDQMRPNWTMSAKGRDALTRFNQLKGRAFLQAYSMLKGGGQITEVEGVKAENAMARLDRALSEDEAQVALKDFREAIEAGMQKLREKAGVSAARGQTATGVSWSVE